MAQYVSRDPFARTTLYKVKSTQCMCDWCGGTDSKGNTWRFHVESDGGRTYLIRGKFCGVKCMKSYYPT